MKLEAQNRRMIQKLFPLFMQIQKWLHIIGMLTHQKWTNHDIYNKFYEFLVHLCIEYHTLLPPFETDDYLRKIWKYSNESNYFLINVYEFDDPQFNNSSEPNNSIQFNWCPNNLRCDVPFPSKMNSNPQTISSIHIFFDIILSLFSRHMMFNELLSLSWDVPINIQVDFVINTIFDSTEKWNSFILLNDNFSPRTQ